MTDTELTIWGRASSANVQKAIWALEELGVRYERIDVGGPYGGLDTDAFGARNPNRRIPVMDHDGLTLWESHAIVRYLAATFGTDRLWPSDPRDRAAVDQWTDWTATTFQPAWIEVFGRVVRVRPSQRDIAAEGRAIQATAQAFGIMEGQLAQTPYLAGDTLSYADIVAGVSLYRWFTLEIERPQLPVIEKWYERLKARPAFEKAVCISYDELRARD